MLKHAASLIGATALLAIAAGCGDGGVVAAQADAMVTPPPDAAVADAAAPEPDAGPPSAGTFIVRIENTSAATNLPTPFSPGAWALHDNTVSFFVTGQADPGQGLESIAEDGDPTALAAALAGLVPSSGVFNTPEGASGPAPIGPGQAYEFTAIAQEDNVVLSFASMLVESNDLFVAAEPAGIALFDNDGNPLAMRDITDQLQLWDLGTEANQAPRMGPHQAPRQGPANTGAGEGAIRPLLDTTRALPAAQDLIEFAVTEAGGVYTITATNKSSAAETGATTLSNIFYATHNSTFQLFAEGTNTRQIGLEELAENGDGAQLEDTANVSGGTDLVVLGDKPALAGEQFDAIVATPSATFPNLSVATMVVASNDAFLAFPPEGVALLDSSNNPRPAADVEADMNRLIAVWDAGTEANQTPGAGSHQPQMGVPASGPADTDDTVRRYADPTNDLSPLQGALMNLSITSQGAGVFEVQIENISNTSNHRATFSDVLWVVHDGTPRLFDDTMPATSDLEQLAEIGNADPLNATLGATLGVSESQVESAVAPTETITFTVNLNSLQRYLNIASMVVPSNDTFWSLGPVGIELVDSNGDPRPQVDIDNDIATLLSAWDAGTERNQAGAIGANQPPSNGDIDAGASEGNGTVRINDDPVWAYPSLGDLIRVTIRPVTQ